MKLRTGAWALTLALGFGAVPLARLAAQPVPTNMQDRDDQNRDRNSRDQTYSDQNRDRNNRDQTYTDNGDRHGRNNRYQNNRYYDMGRQEADADRRSNERRKHDHDFKNSDDRRAYEDGYNSRWQQRSNSSDRDRDEQH